MAKKLLTLLSSLRAKGGQPLQHPYQKKEKLMTATKLQFFNELKDIVGNHYTVFTQINMGDIISLQKGLEPKQKALHQRKIKSKHIDFVLCDPNDSSILAAIELNDKLDKRKEETEVDIFKEKAFKAAGMPLLKFKCNKSYAHEICETLLKNIGFDKHQPDVKPDTATTQKTGSETVKVETTGSTEQLCPKCFSTMIKKISTKRRPVLACSAYPACKTIIAIDNRTNTRSDTVRLS